jgi:hypothetical protein
MLFYSIEYAYRHFSSSGCRTLSALQVCVQHRPGFPEVWVRARGHPPTPEWKDDRGQGRAPLGPRHHRQRLEDRGWRVQAEDRHPRNATAMVYLPATEERRVTEGGEPIGQAVGIEFLRVEGGEVVVAVGSERYEFVGVRNGSV